MIDSLEKRFLLAVPGDDAETALSATIFNYVCLGAIAFVTVAGLASIFIFVRRVSASVSTVAAIILLFVAIYIARRGKVKVGSAVLTVGLWTILSIHVWLAGGIDSIFTSFYAAIIVIAGVLVGPSFTIILAFLTVVLALGMTSLQSLGHTWPSYYPMPPWSAWFMLLFPIFLIVPAINGTLRAFTTSVRRARQEIEERRKAEEAARESEAKYRFLAENASDVMWTMDLNLRTTFVTPSIEKVLGFTPEERVLQDVEDQLTPESLEFARERLLEELRIDSVQGVEEGKFAIVDLDYWHKNGSIVCLQTAVTFIRDEKGAPIGLHGISRDITELKRSQKALKESEERYRRIVETANEGIWSLNEGLSTTFVNQKMAAMLGYAREEMLGRSVRSFMFEEDLTDQREFLRKLGRGETETFEQRFKSKDGSEVWTLVSASRIADQEGNISGSFGMMTDITERKRAEEDGRQLREQLFQAQKLEALGTLTGGIAHDFNNLLTIINGYTELILAEKTEADSNFSDLRKILETGRKGADLVQRLLALSNKGKSNPQPMDLNHAVENTVAVMRRTFPRIIEIETSLGKDLDMVNADASQVEQVLMNLCINAKEAIAEHGRIGIETRNAVVDEERCKLHPGSRTGRYVVINISDTGKGMSRKTAERIFDPFFTTKGWDYKKGTGLGLSVAKGIVERHGGWIDYQTELGKGTTFSLYFPSIEVSPVIEEFETGTKTVQPMEKILLVEDEEYVRDLGKRILESSGYRVITAGNGKEALEICSREQAGIRLVILDLIMPQMDGKQCLEELLRINPRVKVIISTGHSLDAREYLHLGSLAKGFVNKPYEVKQLLETVKRVL